LISAILYQINFLAHSSKCGKTASATVVDHITPHKGDTTLFWDNKNSATEPGGAFAKRK
jgi:hypothetical protein